jgi:glycosyltransferase involved in cell wall biosynthesis
MRELVTVLINNFNYGRFLGEAIESALNQDYAAVEVVVVDDGSTDNSRAVIDGFGAAVRPVLKENGGLASAYNAGIAASAGDWIVMLDADDFLYPNAVSAIVAARSERCSMVQFRLSVVDESGNRIGADPPVDVPLPSGDVVPRLLATGRYVTALGGAYRQDALRNVLPVPEELFPTSADGYLRAVVPFHGELVSIAEELAAYRRHGSHWGFSPTHQGPGPIQGRLEHDLARECCIRSEAARHGLSVPDDLLLRDWSHVLNRVSLLRLSPSTRLFPRDRRLGLVRAGVSALKSAPGLSGADRIFYACVLVAIGLLPRPLARAVAVWALASRPRAPWLRAGARALRALTGFSRTPRSQGGAGPRGDRDRRP